MSRALISDQISTTKELQYKSIICVLNCQMCLHDNNILTGMFFFCS